MTVKSKCSESRLSELIDTYEKLVFSICYKMTEDYFIAEDLTQETFITVFQKYDTFDGENEKAWLCRIAVNKSIDYLRSAKRKGIPTEKGFFEGIEEKRGSPEELCLEEEIRQKLEKSCRSLRAPYDEIAREYYLIGKSTAEMAKERNIGNKTMQTKIYRARDMLRKIYGKEGLP